MLDMNHHLFKLSKAIDWISLEKEIPRMIDAQYQSQWRVISGSIYLKSFYDFSSADVIRKWSECAYLRFFCSGKILTENNKPFPVSMHILDQLSINLAGEGYDAMIKALRDDRPTIRAPNPSASTH